MYLPHIGSNKRDKKLLDEYIQENQEYEIQTTKAEKRNLAYDNETLL